jgi:hypothetical protein
MAEQKMIPAGVGCVWCGAWLTVGAGEGIDDFYWWERQIIVPLHTNLKRKTFGVACSARIRCVDTYSNKSSNLPLANKSCT